LAKFFTGLYIFSNISGLGFLRAELLFIMTPPTGLLITLILAFLFAVLPMSASYALIAVFASLHLSSNLEIAIIVFLCLLCIIFFYVRLAPKESVLILLTVICFKFKLPYFAPLFAGLYFSLTSAIPVMLGVMIWHFIPVVIDLVGTSASAGFSVSEMTETIPAIYENIFEALSGNTQWIFISFSFAMIILIVYAISKLSVNFSAEIAVLFGAAVNMISLIAAAVAIRLDINLFGMALSTVACVALVYLIRFFDVALDYSRVERVQFSDEDNFYYVKVVPKLLTSAGQKEKRAAVRRETEE